MAQDSSEVFYDFDLTIQLRGTGLYAVSLVAETGKKVAEETFQYFSSLRDVPEALKKAKSTDPKDLPSMYDKLKDFGEKLYKALLSGMIGREVRRLMEVGGSVALRLRVEPSDLKDVPWETIYDGTEFLATSSGMVLSRIPLGVEKSDRPVLTTTPNLACILMRPFLEAYGDESRWEARKKALRALFGELSQSGAVNVAVHEVTTLDDIKYVLGDDKFEIVHLFCLSEDRQVLLAEGELIGAATLTAGLSALKNLRLAVLSSVWSHNVAVETIGRDLVSAKVPAALVMPMEMGPEQENAFLSAFYHALGSGKRLDYATALARKAAMEAGETRSDFMLPVFYMTVAQPFKPPAPVKKLQPREKSAVTTRLVNLAATAKGNEKAMALANIACLQQQRGEYDIALENYDLAVPLFEESQDKYNLAVALNNMATILIEREEYKRAIKPLLKCTELRSELGKRDEASVAYNKLGYCYRKAGKLKQSVESYRSALDLHMQLHDRKGLCDSYFNLGIAYAKMGELEAAADMLQKSVETAMELAENTRATDALEYLGAVCFDSENYTRAKEAYEKSRELRREADDEAGMAITLNNLGNVEQRLDNLDAAQKYYKEAMAINEKTGKTLGIASCLHNLAVVQHKQGETVEAICCALKARNIAAKNSIEDVEYMSSALLDRIKTKIGRDEYAGLLSQAQERMGEMT